VSRARELLRRGDVWRSSPALEATPGGRKDPQPIETRLMVLSSASCVSRETSATASLTSIIR
jgi:hypothetical protein